MDERNEIWKLTQGPSSDSCGGGDRGRRGGSSGFPGAGGFWTGAATGGLLGYMLGNRGSVVHSFDSVQRLVDLIR